MEGRITKARMTESPNTKNPNPNYQKQRVGYEMSNFNRPNNWWPN